MRVVFTSGPMLTLHQSHFWHLSVKNRIYAPSTYVSEKILRLRPGSFVSRYMTLILTFIFSIGFHALGDISCGIPPHKTGAPHFFLVQIGAIFVEDIVRHFWSRVVTSSGSRTHDQKGYQKGPTTWQKWLGRIWVFLFMYWCTAFYAYPVTFNNGDGLIVPFSIMRRVFLSPSDS